jgi:hypothetical protein
VKNRRSSPAFVVSSRTRKRWLYEEKRGGPGRSGDCGGGGATDCDKRWCCDAGRYKEIVLVCAAFLGGNKKVTKKKCECGF